MTTQTKSHTSIKVYLLVFFWLCILTAVEVGLTYIDMSRSLLACLLIGTSLVKASLVAVFFMHLKFEGKLIYFLIFFPGIIALAYIIFLFPDIVYGYWK